MVDHSVGPPVKNRTDFQVALQFAERLFDVEQSFVVSQHLLARTLLDRLRAFVAEGDKTVVVASHITDGLDEIAEAVTFLLDGRIVLKADSDDLMTKWKWIHYREGALDSAIEDRLASVRRQPFGNRGLTNDFPSLRDALALTLASGDARVDHASLEDILLSFVKGA